MADESGELRRVNWSEAFDFTFIFKSFKLAIHPSKLVLALAALLLIYGLGWLLGGIWSLAGSVARPGEVANHVMMNDGDFDDNKEAWLKGRPARAVTLVATARNTYATFENRFNRGPLAAAFTERLAKYNADHKDRAVEAITEEQARKDGWAATVDKAQDDFDQQIDKIEYMLDDLDELALDKIKDDKSLSDEQRKDARQAAGEAYADAHVWLANQKRSFEQDTLGIEGQNVFDAFVDWQLECARQAIGSVWKCNFVGGLDFYQQIARNRQHPDLSVNPAAIPAGNALTLGGNLAQGSAVPATQPAGFIYWLLMAWQGVVWLLGEHIIFAAVFGLLSLAIVAVLGGAIARIAALHFARDEKISMFQALKFSLAKLPNFFSAPLIPLAIIFVLGGLLALGGLIGSIPVVGEIIVGILFFLAVVLGALIAFLSIGLIAGCSLMYPTIAVEGSDSFDAISRSFSYVFARPWRTLFYGLVALVYGVLTYLFVRLFAWLALAATHMFVSWGTIGGGEGIGPGADKLDAMWHEPTFDNLFSGFGWAGMSGSESVGAVLIGIWVFVVAATVWSYLLSYSISSSTVIYSLLRRKVDATDLDDVYVEEQEEVSAPTAETSEQGEEQAPAQPESTEEKPPQDKPE